ncbi:hypothetical protein [Flagellimonas sp. S3867]|uniref:DUF7660 family protein n=1 Tax=Flagellimonas sp. S3867 TaxID=2768063 RepID=UPI001683E2D8|nr:hypothetical protein [Flagellimonas sp. S3867]
MKNKDAWDIGVTDRKSFEEFINLLLTDFKKNKSNWENNRLELFLEAMSAYTRDLDGYYKNMEPDQNADFPTWKVFADIMRGAVVYE